jgi:biopolymer transport protein TolR
MAMALGGGGAKRGRRGLRRGGLMSDINVTPMVDVMLVLLIIFMVAAPLLTSGVPIDLPQTTARAMSIESKPITVTVRPDGALFLGEDQIEPATLLAAVNAAAAGNLEQRLYIRGDATADYGLIMDVMGTLSGAGYAHIGLITEQKKAP